MADSDKLFSVVVAGAMNPPVHHPYWYHQTKLIDDLQLKESLENGKLVSVPGPNGMSQFRVGDFGVKCQLERWEIHTDKADQLPAIIAIASKLYDDILKHTPLQAIGINVQFIKTIEGAGAAIGKAIVAGPIDIGAGEPTGGGFAIVYSNGENVETVSVTVQHMLGAEPVMIVTNIHRDIASENTWFSIGPTLNEMHSRVGPAIDRATSIFRQLGDK